MLSKEMIIAERKPPFDCNKGSEAGLKLRAISKWCPLRLCTGSWDNGGGETVCQGLAEYLVVTVLELYGQEEEHNSIFFLHLQFLASLAVTHRCNSRIKDKKMASEKLLLGQFRDPPFPKCHSFWEARIVLFSFVSALSDTQSFVSSPRFLWG